MENFPKYKNNSIKKTKRNMVSGSPKPHGVWPDEKSRQQLNGWVN